MIVIIIMLLFIGVVDVFVLSLFVRSWQKHNQDFSILADEIITRKVEDEIELLYCSENFSKRLDVMDEAIEDLGHRMEYCRQFVVSDFNGVRRSEKNGYSCNDDIDNDLFPED